MAKRDYDNSLRQQRAQQTRDRILEATVAELSKREGELSIRAVAAAAGVSQPTVYKHFPNREALIAAVQVFVSERMGLPPRPSTLEEAVESPPAVWAWFDTHAEAILASRHLDPTLRASLDEARSSMVDRVFGEEVAHLEPEAQAATKMLLALLMGGTAWRQARSDQLSTQVAAERASWAVGALIEALRRERTHDES